MSIIPLIWHLKRGVGKESTHTAEPPNFSSVTIMLTQLCNLDCWMCDFAVSKGLKEGLPWTVDEYVSFLKHGYFRKLSSIGFTGGEPFAYAQIKPLYVRLQEVFPQMFISFSSNATLLKPMMESFETTQNWNRTRLFTSIDGIATHDVQRGKPGAFDKSMGNLAKLRERFTKLGIDIKFTITPVNYKELRAAYSYCTDRGFNFTAKMLENNPFYTNVLSYKQHKNDFQFDAAQISEVRQQLEWILTHQASAVSAERHNEMQEVYDSLDPAWRRGGRCNVPSGAAFLDSSLNLFTCKEYPPVVNLSTASLDDIPASAVYQQIIESEKSNLDACARCTSQLKKKKVENTWAHWLS